MKKEFKPIAMKCNKEQFEAVKPKLKDYNYEIVCAAHNFEKCEYLINNLGGYTGQISNVLNEDKRSYNRTVHETWNETIFLEACGIETEETFKITKEQIIILNTDGNKDIRRHMSEWFPSAFEPEKKELVVGVWYVVDYDGLYSLFNFVKLDGDDLYAYGFNYKKEFLTEKIFCDISNHDTSKIREATQQEVEEAIGNEIKRRYKVGDYVKSLYHKNNPVIKIAEIDPVLARPSSFHVTGSNSALMPVLFDNGKFAEIIQPKKMTQAEIETELGYNIEIV